MSEVKYFRNLAIAETLTMDEWKKMHKEMDYHDWYGYDSIQEMKNRGVYDIHCWDDLLYEVKKDLNDNWIEA